MGSIEAQPDLKPSKPMKDKLNRIQRAQENTESTFEDIVMMVANLTSLLCEIQNEPDITPEHIEELKEDIQKQEAAVEERAKSVNALVQQCHIICKDWKVKVEPVVNTPAPVTPPTVTTKRRFIPIDGFKPKTLSIEATYEAFLDFKKRFSPMQRHAMKVSGLQR